jgi:hypothetical protein
MDDHRFYLLFLLFLFPVFSPIFFLFLFLFFLKKFVVDILVTVGHTTVMGSCRFFCSENPDLLNEQFSIKNDFLYAFYHQFDRLIFCFY